MKKRNRILPVVTAAVLVLCLALSLVFVADSVNHVCCGKECAVCAAVHTVIKLFDVRNTAGILPAILTVAVANAALILITQSVFFAAETPVLLKVKLSD
ncbi:MAG: hypothetical protein IKH65_01585 [Clostridia bacterium]|nr:hypothetical protein [Clostridia bacterium]